VAGSAGWLGAGARPGRAARPAACVCVCVSVCVFGLVNGLDLKRQVLV